MNRRAFLRMSTGCVAGGLDPGLAVASTSTTTRSAGPPAGSAAASPQPSPWSIMVVDADEHRRRLQNIGECNAGIRKCLHRHLVTHYMPGQVAYNLGEYPCRKPWDPNEWDERQLDELR